MIIYLQIIKPDCMVVFEHYVDLKEYESKLHSFDLFSSLFETWWAQLSNIIKM